MPNENRSLEGRVAFMTGVLGQGTRLGNIHPGRKPRA